MVMGGHSRTRGCGFESQHRRLDGHFSHYIALTIVSIKNTENKCKRGMKLHFLVKRAAEKICQI